MLLRVCCKSMQWIHSPISHLLNREIDPKSALETILEEVKLRIEKRLSLFLSLFRSLSVSLFFLSLFVGLSLLTIVGCLVTSNVIDVQVITTIVAELSSNDEDLNQESLEVFAHWNPFFSRRLCLSCLMLFIVQS
jgi:hypothetical protein